MSARRGNMGRCVVRWTPVEDKKLKTLLAEGYKPDHICVVLGRTIDSVRARAHMLRTTHTETQERACLCCGKSFISAWKGNRLCPYCSRQAQDTSPYAP